MSNNACNLSTSRIVLYLNKLKLLKLILDDLKINSHEQFIKFVGKADSFPRDKIVKTHFYVFVRLEAECNIPATEQ